MLLSAVSHLVRGWLLGEGVLHLRDLGAELCVVGSRADDEGRAQIEPGAVLADEGDLCALDGAESGRFHVASSADWARSSPNCQSPVRKNPVRRNAKPRRSGHLDRRATAGPSPCSQDHPSFRRPDG